MSLISRKAIQRAGPDKHDERITTFRKEQDGTYTKITHTMSRDHKSGAIKEMKRNPPVESGPFLLVSNPELGFDEKVEYEDFNGSAGFMYFKRSSLKNEEG